MLRDPVGPYSLSLWNYAPQDYPYNGFWGTYFHNSSTYGPAGGYSLEVQGLGFRGLGVEGFWGFRVLGLTVWGRCIGFRGLGGHPS